MARSVLVRVGISFVAASTAFAVTLSSGLAPNAAIAAKLDRPAAVAGIVDDSVTVALARDLPGALATSRDEGKLNDATILPHIRLELTRPAALQAAFDKLTHDQTVRGSASYHHWLMPNQLRSYGPAETDVAAVVGWLQSRGLTVNSVSRSGMSIDFGGPSGRVAAAFRTQLHSVLHAGEAHITNIAAPAIPAALASVVTGVTLSNFFPKPAMRRRTPSFTVGKSGYYAVAPADFATIYNVNPLRTGANYYGQPITGAGVTLAMVEQTLIQTKDWTRFRSAFGLSGYHGTLSLTHPGGCASPGFIGDEGEAALDVEWSGAVAPDATVLEASCAGTAPFEFGVMTALMNLVEDGTPATIFSISYGGDETENGYAFIEAWKNLVEEGAATGKSIFVSTGDSGVSGQEGEAPGGPPDSVGLFINGLSDTKYNVAVGGTDFYDTALGEDGKYWSATNGAAKSSALSYIPEIPWNNSCASSIIWKFAKSTGAIPFCNSNSTAPLQNDIGGSGGQSVYYSKPYWQAGVLGVPNDGVRDQPDVSLFAANGIWGHFYVFCMSDASEGGSPCKYATPDEVFGNAAGGTSFASPAFAGIMALVEQVYGGSATPLGNPAPVFYAVAKAEFTTPLGLSGCDSSLGSKISPACAFYYVTAGNNAQPCLGGTVSCVSGAKGVGVLAAKIDGVGEFAYPAQPGYSLATGLGTVNVTNLLYNYDAGI